MIWVNDGLVESNTASVSVLDHGFTVADGVFETLKVVENVPFALSRHLDRLEQSANGLGLALLDRDRISQAVFTTIEANSPLQLGRLRITVTSGSGPLGSNRGDNPITLVIATAPVSLWPATTTLAVVPWRRNDRSAVVGLKTTSYAENVVALEAAHRTQFSEALFLDTQERLSEGTGTNIFFVKNGIVFTPSEKCGILRGITRDLVIDLAHEIGIEVRQGEFSFEDLMVADEIFITSSTRDVHPVTTLGVLNEELDLVASMEFDYGPTTAALQLGWQTAYTQQVNP